MPQIAPISNQIWDMKYRLKDGDGAAVDTTIADTWRRVARALAQPEAADTRAAYETAFFDALKDFKVLPAGRILAGAGTDRRVTLFNCFVMGEIPDTMSGIFDALKEAALTMQQGGGIGYDFSTLRPRGAPVRGVGADASGPLSFMDVWDAMCRTIMSAGSRRGAMMATMRCDHPDIEDFISAKREAGRLRMFNLSVLVTDPFMDAVRDDADWQLTFDGEVYKTVRAKALWDQIMTSTYEYAEPGVIFIDRINRRNNLHYAETISATNPCVTADTWVHTSQGPRQVSDLFGLPFTARVDGEEHRSGRAGFFATGRKPVYRLETDEGYEIRLTGDHKVLRNDGTWVTAESLLPNDRIVLNDHRAGWDWAGDYEQEHGYLVGLLVGGGAIEDEAIVLQVDQGAMTATGEVAHPGVRGVMETAMAAAQSLPCRSDAAHWSEPTGGARHLVLPGLKGLARDLGLARGERSVTPAMEKTSGAFHVGFLKGLFDMNAEIVLTGRSLSVALRPDHGGVDLLQAVQRMLARLGIKSVLRAKGKALHLKGGHLQRYADLIGFADADKQARLDTLLINARAPRPDAFTAKVIALIPEGEEDVYDVQIPGLNAFDGNGLYVHNCGEQPLPPYGTCLLGSINLAKLVDQPFEEAAHIDEERLGTMTRTMVRMLDNVIDVSKYPLPEQRNEAIQKRRIGLGVTGLADALILCGARYGSDASVKLVEHWLGTIERHAYLASAELAKEKGPFPLYDRDQYLAGEHIRELPADVRAAIAEHGVRNALLTSIAPTGTISLFADNVSSGLEPVFSFAYTRKVLQPDGSKTEEEVSDYAYRLYRQLKGEQAPLTDAFVDAQGLTPSDHLRIQAAVQTYIDSSISKTINLPEDIPFDTFKDVYAKAYEMGCKGCTTYRPNDITGSVLEIKKDKKQESAEAANRPVPVEDSDGIVRIGEPLDRPEQIPGNTYKVRWPESDHAMYITVNDVIDHQGRRRPFEVFINSKNMEHYAWTVALTRMISAVFRRGGDVTFVVEELKAVFDPRGGHWMQGRYVPSILAAIGDVIERHMKEIGFLESDEDDGTVEPTQKKKVVNIGGGMGRFCPKCAQPTLIKSEGCDTCTSCGYSKCG